MQLLISFHSTVAQYMEIYRNVLIFQNSTSSCIVMSSSLSCIYWISTSSIAITSPCPLYSTTDEGRDSLMIFLTRLADGFSARLAEIQPDLIRWWMLSATKKWQERVMNKFIWLTWERVQRRMEQLGIPVDPAPQSTEVWTLIDHSWSWHAGIIINFLL